MTIKTQTNIPRIERGRTKMYVPNGDSETVFAYPFFKGKYRSVGKQILDAGLRVPTGEEVANLLYASYKTLEVHNEPEFKNVREIIKGKGLWSFNRNLWTPEGLYVVSDTKALGLSEEITVKQLEEKLKGAKELSLGGIRFSSDGSVRFAPKDSYQIGEHTPEELAKQGDVIAGYGIEGAEKLGEVSSEFDYDPITFGVEVEEGYLPVLRVSNLGWYLDDNGLLGISGESDVSNYSCAFGLLAH